MERFVKTIKDDKDSYASVGYKAQLITNGGSEEVRISGRRIWHGLASDLGEPQGQAFIEDFRTVCLEANADGQGTKALRASLWPAGNVGWQIAGE